MTSVTLNEVELIANPPRQVREWGSRLIASYRLSVEFDDELHEFIWVLAGENPDSPCTEYDNDFDEFLVTICKGDTFSKCKRFVGEIQEKFSLAVHFFHTRDKAIETKLPIKVVR
ncbi:hypothetical protein [Bacterioplanoides pacificum]|uniref:Integron gene cassette protein n=1 Tax=Bacterioplanoides pacificum TaxID=1171596 RepID=A0ABV7VTW1_9GAMM